MRLEDHRQARGLGAPFVRIENGAIESLRAQRREILRFDCRRLFPLVIAIKRLPE